MNALTNNTVFFDDLITTEQLIKYWKEKVDSFNTKAYTKWKQERKLIPWWKRPFTRGLKWYLIKIITTYDDLFGPPAYDMILKYQGKKYKILAFNSERKIHYYLPPYAFWEGSMIWSDE
ncbi:MAG: hypothetical protein Q4B28_03945 [bacterium]|nr:hypothetical protein [bacterium]